MNHHPDPELHIGQRLWVSPLGRQGVCLGIFGDWLLVQDDQGRYHAASPVDVEPCRPFPEEDRPAS